VFLRSPAGDDPATSLWAYDRATGTEREVASAARILELMSLGAAQGTELTLSAEGPDAEQALEALATLFAHEFEIVYKDSPASNCR